MGKTVIETLTGGAPNSNVRSVDGSCKYNNPFACFQLVGKPPRGKRVQPVEKDTVYYHNIEAQLQQNGVPEVVRNYLLASVGPTEFRPTAQDLDRILTEYSGGSEPGVGGVQVSSQPYEPPPAWED